jgi:hypothetical protein
MAPNPTLRRLESVPLGAIYARRREAIGSGLSCRRRSPRPDQVKFEACIPIARSALYAHPFAPDRKERGHCHWAEEKPDQSKRLQTANNSDQYQQER